MSSANNLELNKGDDFIIGLDISRSMSATDCKGGVSRIAFVLESLAPFIGEAFKWDTDGVSLYAYGAGVQAFPDLTPDQFDAKLAAFKSGAALEGMTNTHLAIRGAWQEHQDRQNEQTFFMLFTDGEPSDPSAVEQAIIDITNAVEDENEFRIQILTVGEPSSGLTAWLTALDDDLKSKGAKYDIVDVKRLEDVDFAAAVNGALVD
jgi:hypothetical protein